MLSEMSCHVSHWTPRTENSSKMTSNLLRPISMETGICHAYSCYMESKLLVIYESGIHNISLRLLDTYIAKESATRPLVGFWREHERGFVLLATWSKKRP